MEMKIISTRIAIKCVHTSISAVKISATFELIPNSKVQHYWLHHQCSVNSNCKETGIKMVATLSSCCYTVC